MGENEKLCIAKGFKQRRGKRCYKWRGKKDKKMKDESTMGQNRKKHKIDSRPIIHCPTSEVVSKVRERASERASERVSGARKRAKGRASGPVLQSGFLVDLAHSARGKL